MSPLTTSDVFAILHATFPNWHCPFAWSRLRDAQFLHEFFNLSIFSSHQIRSVSSLSNFKRPTVKESRASKSFTPLLMPCNTYFPDYLIGTCSVTWGNAGDPHDSEGSARGGSAEENDRGGSSKSRSPQTSKRIFPPGVPGQFFAWHQPMGGRMASLEESQKAQCSLGAAACVFWQTITTRCPRKVWIILRVTVLKSNPWK